MDNLLTVSHDVHHHHLKVNWNFSVKTEISIKNRKGSSKFISHSRSMLRILSLKTLKAVPCSGFVEKSSSMVPDGLLFDLELFICNHISNESIANVDMLICLVLCMLLPLPIFSRSTAALT